jgi:tRNA dimethylallyltransferase
MPPQVKKSKVFFLIGPTAVGKTEVAIELARKINAEVISCDSMQVYKGLDLLSSKAPALLRKKIPHHLIDIIVPSKEYNVSKYRKQAVEKVKEILKKGKLPLFVGGSGLYFKVLLDGIFLAQTQDKKIRQRLYKEAEVYGKDKLFFRLKKVDPEVASRIHPHDLRRIVRALEVYKKTGIPISEWQKRCRGITDDYEVKVFGLDRNKKDLHRRIDKRLKNMSKKGLVREVKKLLPAKLSRTARQALGIKEIEGYLKKEYSLKEAKELLRLNTYKYVKKQLTWFKKDKRIDWIEIKDGQGPKVIAKQIWKKLY